MCCHHSSLSSIYSRLVCGMRSFVLILSIVPCVCCSGVRELLPWDGSLDYPHRLVKGLVKVRVCRVYNIFLVCLTSFTMVVVFVVRLLLLVPTVHGSLPLLDSIFSSIVGCSLHGWLPLLVVRCLFWSLALVFVVEPSYVGVLTCLLVVLCLVVVDALNGGLLRCTYSTCTGSGRFCRCCSRFHVSVFFYPLSSLQSSLLPFPCCLLRAMFFVLCWLISVSVLC